MSLLLLFQDGGAAPPVPVVIDTHDGGDERAREYWRRKLEEAERPAPQPAAIKDTEAAEDPPALLAAEAVAPSVDWSGAFDRAASLEVQAATLAQRMADDADEEEAEMLLLLA